MTNAPALVCAKCGHNGFTVATPPDPKDAAPGQQRKWEIPPATAAELEIQEKLKRAEDCIKRDASEHALAGVEPNLLFRLAAFHTRLERIEEDQKWCVEHIKTLEAKHQRLADSFGGFTSELNHIGTRQFETGRLLGIVSESCAAAHKAARQARWGAFLLAVVVLGLLCGLVLGKVA